MTVILVVDDSAVDRRLVGGLLATQGGYVLRFAVDGAEALAAIGEDPPDLVLTDLQMPVMDGLQLVSQASRTFPSIPLILMTSQGSEEVVVEALRRGAASYVPKRMLSDQLPQTIRRVLQAAGHRRHQARLMDCLEQSEYAFVLGNDETLISPLVGFLQERLAVMGLCDDADLVRVSVALEEAMANALFHGNLEIASHLREDGGAAFCELARRRRECSPYAERRIYVIVQLSRHGATFTIRDEGPGFDPQQAPDPCTQDLEKLSGRGLLLMRTFMDEVCFNEKGNEVRLVKRAAAQEDGQSSFAER